MENVIQKEAAEAQIEKLLESYDIDEEFIIEDQVTAFKLVKLGLLKAIMRGRMSIEEDETGVIIHHKPVETEAFKGQTIIYKRFNGRSAIQSEKGEGSASKSHNMLGSMSGHGAGEMQKFVGIDQSDIEKLGALFLLT